jgi:hypothetical protein
MVRRQIDQVPGDIVISGHFRQTVMWGAFIVILALGLVVSLSAQPTATGRAQAVVFFAIFIALCVLLWWRRNRRRPRLQVTGQEIRYWDGGGNLSFLLTRGQGGQDHGEPGVLCLLPPRRDGGSLAGRRLTIAGSGEYLNVAPFRAREVRQACTSRGWRFDDDPALIAREACRLAELLQQVRQQRTLPQ